MECVEWPHSDKRCRRALALCTHCHPIHSQLSLPLSLWPTLPPATAALVLHHASPHRAHIHTDDEAHPYRLTTAPVAWIAPTTRHPRRALRYRSRNGRPSISQFGASPPPSCPCLRSPLLTIRFLLLLSPLASCPIAPFAVPPWLSPLFLHCIPAPRVRAHHIWCVPRLPVAYFLCPCAHAACDIPPSLALFLHSLVLISVVAPTAIASILSATRWF